MRIACACSKCLTFSRVSQGYSGILPKMVDSIARRHDPPLVPTLLDGWRSQQSMDYQKQLKGSAASSYTACVMDVVVGKVDICVSKQPHCKRLHPNIVLLHFRVTA